MPGPAAAMQRQVEQGATPAKPGTHGLARWSVTSAMNRPRRADGSYDRRAAYWAAVPLSVCQMDQL